MAAKKPAKKKAVKKKRKVGHAAPVAANVDYLINDMTKAKGRQVVFRATEMPHKIRLRIPSSSLVINRLLGGGCCLPRITQFYGPSGVFKSTGVYDVIGNAQAMGLRTFLFDTEGAAEESYLRKWGIDPEALGLGPANMTADDVIDSILFMLRHDDPPELICLDSITALVTEREIRKGTPGKDRGQVSFVDSQNKLQGWNGKFNSIAFKAINQANRGTTAIVFTNQMRDNVGEMVKAVRNQGKQKPTGGHAPKYYSSDIVYMEHEAAELGEYANIPIGNTVRKRKKFNGWMIGAYVEKSRTTSNVSEEMFFRFNPKNKTIDHIGEIIDLSRMDGLLTLSGAYYKYKDQNIGQGMLQVRKQLKESQARVYAALSEGEQPDEDELFYALRTEIEAKTEELGALEGDPT